MSKLRVSKPEKFEDIEKWIVYILDENRKRRRRNKGLI
jgi:hypothetical protein